MIITQAIFDKIADGEIFRIVTTKYQRFHEPLVTELTFVCQKGKFGDDWAIYCHLPDKTIEWIARFGDKVKSEDIIKSICPCDEEVFKKYRL